MRLIEILAAFIFLLTFGSCSMIGVRYARHPVLGLVLIVILALVMIGIYYVLRKAKEKEDRS